MKTENGGRRGRCQREKLSDNVVLAPELFVDNSKLSPRACCRKSQRTRSGSPKKNMACREFVDGLLGAELRLAARGPVTFDDLESFDDNFLATVKSRLATQLANLIEAVAKYARGKGRGTSHAEYKVLAPIAQAFSSEPGSGE